jgi:hypothetical protein
LQDSISSLESEVLTEAVLESGGKRTKVCPFLLGSCSPLAHRVCLVLQEDENVMREMRLESLEYQNEMIASEREEAVRLSFL